MHNILLSKLKNLDAKLTLSIKLSAGFMILLGLSLMLAIGLFLFIGKDYRNAKKSYQEIIVYRNVLIAANKISAERGPGNALLGGDFPADAEARKRLSQFRADTDNILDVVQESLQPEDRATLAHARAMLLDARRKLDDEIAIPFHQRTLETITLPIRAMFNTLDAMLPLINHTAPNYSRGVEISDEALIGKQLFEIRDYAGRLGSILAPYIAKREKISDADRNQLQQTIGKIQQLWELSYPHLQRYPTLSRSVSLVESVFFDKGLEIIHTLENEAKTARFSFTTATMTNQLVPTFFPLEEVRLSYLSLMLEQANQKLQSASWWFLIVGILTTLIITVNVILVLGAQRLIFSPLLKARDDIVALADERELMHSVSSRQGSPEIEEVFNAINILHTRLLERQQLTARLKLQASTDGLTGLLNRRIFDQIVSGSADFETFPQEIGLILVDIDKFKHINDSRGHEAGDTILKLIALRIKQHVRSDDFVARYGGEEFAIVMPGTDLVSFITIAENLRITIADTPFELENGILLNVTASFGVSAGLRGENTSQDLFRRADNALYEAKRNGRNRVCHG